MGDGDDESDWNRGLAEFIQSVSGDLVGFVIQLGASQHDANDVVQTVLERLLENWPMIREPHVWIYTVARREYVRMSRRSRREECTDEVKDGVSLWLTPEGYAEATESFSEVSVRLGVLPRQQREVIVLRMNGFTDSEIARLLRTTRRAVQQAARRARDKLDATGDWQLRRQER